MTASGPIDEILAQIPLADLAAKLGVDEATAEQASRQVLPALLGGLQANSADPAGAASLATAVGQHDPGLVDGGVDLGQVDTADGAKIVGHVFGENKDQVVNQLGGLGGADYKGIVQQLLPILAPIVLAWLAKKFTATPAGGTQAGGAAGGLGDLLGGLLGGGAAGQSGGALGGGLGDLLGGLLGGGRR